MQEKERERKALEARSRDFNIGKYLYERGQYPEAAAAFTKALDAEGPFSQLGGEVQLWLALAYQVGPGVFPWVSHPLLLVA